MEYSYEARIAAFNSDRSTWSYEANDTSGTSSVPSDFGGSGQGLTPEHLYALSLLNCYVATLNVVAQKSDATISHGKASITIDLDTETEPPINKAQISLDVNPEPDTMQHLARKAKEHCYIHHSVKTKVDVTVNEDPV